MSEKMAVLHDISGRIRVYYPQLIFSDEVAQRMERNLVELLGVQKVRMEPRIGTITVGYDPEQLRAYDLIQALLSFSYYEDTPLISNQNAKNWQSFYRARNRSVVSGCLLVGNYLFKLAGKPSSTLDIFSTIYTGYTVLSHGDRKKGQIRHPDILTGLISSVTLGPGKMNEVAFTSWLMNLFELYHDYQELMRHKFE